MNRIVVLSSVVALLIATGWAAVTRAAPPPSTSTSGPALTPTPISTIARVATRTRPSVQKVIELKPEVPVDRSPARIFGGLRSGFHPTVGRALGLPSAADIDTADLGAPMRMVHVRLDELQAYDGRSPADALLHEGPLVTRLVRVSGQVRSSLILSNARGGWETVQMGDSTRAAAIDQVVGAVSGARGVAPEALFLVNIPALGLDFLAYKDGTQLVLASLFDAPTYGLRGAQPGPAEQVLASLVGPARQVPLLRR